MDWFFLFDDPKVEFGFDHIELDGEEFFGEDIAQKVFAIAGGPNGDPDVFFIDGGEKGKADDMIPVEMAEKEMDVFVVLQGVSEGAYPCSCIENNQGVAIAQFEAARIASKLNIFGSAD